MASAQPGSSVTTVQRQLRDDSAGPSLPDGGYAKRATDSKGICLFQTTLPSSSGLNQYRPIKLSAQTAAFPILAELISGYARP